MGSVVGGAGRRGGTEGCLGGRALLVHGSGRCRACGEGVGEADPLLRLLGTLDTEFSCANSRFFRTVLYPNAAVGKALREQYILHWQSHRPVPKLTIDFGDGRKIEAITGNSVHYVLTPDGRVVDVIPGLYGPAAFLRAGAANEIAMQSAEPDFGQRLTAYHTQRLADVRFEWDSDLRQVGVARFRCCSRRRRGARGSRFLPRLRGRGFPRRRRRRSFPLVAVPIARHWLPARMKARGRSSRRCTRKTRASTPAARGHSREGGDDGGVGESADLSKMVVEDPMLVMIRNFERSVAEDTVRNEYLFHSQIHEWFVKNQVRGSWMIS